MIGVLYNDVDIFLIFEISWGIGRSYCSWWCVRFDLLKNFKVKCVGCMKGIILIWEYLWVKIDFNVGVGWWGKMY